MSLEGVPCRVIGDEDGNGGREEILGRHRQRGKIVLKPVLDQYYLDEYGVRVYTGQTEERGSTWYFHERHLAPLKPFKLEDFV